MPTLAEVVDLVHGWYPPETADEWDAVGLAAGDPAADVRRILLAVDPVRPVARRGGRAGTPTCCSPTTRCSCAGSTGSPRPRPRAAPWPRSPGPDCGLLTAHTNADHACPGVSDALARALGLRDVTARRGRAAGRSTSSWCSPRRATPTAIRAAIADGRRGTGRRLRHVLVDGDRRGPVPPARGRPPGDRPGRRARGQLDEVRIEAVLPRSRRARGGAARCWRPTPTRRSPTT